MPVSAFENHDVRVNFGDMTYVFDERVFLLSEEDFLAITYHRAGYSDQQTLHK